MEEIYRSLIKNGFKEDWMVGEWEKDKRRFIREQEQLNNIDVKFTIEDIYDNNWGQ